MRPLLLVIAGVLGLILLHAGLLWIMGQPFMYSGGYIKIWHGIVLSDGNSQHLSDWYSLSHIIHGVLFYALLAYFFPRMSVGMRLLLAIGIEMGWELFENTDMIIDRYREQALAQGYSGDSVVNSIGDIVSVIIGFLLAWKLPWWASIVFVILLELVALYFIRDALALNIIQLIHPVDAIGAWQAGR
jgi:hypothetical protein